MWCTGFRPSLRHLAPLRLRHARGDIPVTGTRSDAEPRLHLLGYEDWTGPSSATLIGASATLAITLGGYPALFTTLAVTAALATAAAAEMHGALRWHTSGSPTAGRDRPRTEK
ncbi:hypothetical protein [Actinoallomurus acaciae]|uniref:Uncharacterized protein n=1 Tax=Actinoallomurus acaciae TaxID=502577 RepID=A0ABV5Y7M4_9ACTN